MTGIVNKRVFSRRKLGIEFNLIVSGETVPAVVTDLSIEGIGIFIKGKNDLNAPVLDLRIRDIELDVMGKIVWKRADSSGLRVGVTRMGLLDGMLGYYRLADLVSGIRRSRKTGVLSIEKDSWQRKIFFKDGEMVFSSSDQEHEQIGTVLLSEGKITAHQYQNSLLLANKTGKSQGAVLAEMRYLTPRELVQAIHQRVESVVMKLCNIEDAKFVFREEALPREEIIILKLNANDLLYRGSKKIERIDRFRSRYLYKGAYLSISTEAPALLSRIILDDQDRDILKLINNRTPLMEILTVSPLNEEDTLRSLYALFNAQLVEVEEAEESEKTGADADEQGISPELSDKIDRLYLEHKTLGYHGVLGIQPNSTPAEIKHAYHSLAKVFHPDRYLNIQSNILKEKLNVIFAYISEAYRQLTRPASSPQQQTEQSSSAQPEPPPMNNKNMAQMKFRQGRELMSSHDYENAMTFFGQAAYLDESVAEYHFYYGIALLKNSKVKEAEQSIRKALQRSPYNADYIAELGHIYLALGFMTRAKNSFDKALRLKPSHKRATEGMNKVQEQRKD